MAVQERRTAAVAALPARGQAKPAAEPEVESAEQSAETLADPDDPGAAFLAEAPRYALKALNVLAGLMEKATSEAVRVSAANSLIDRAHGRPAQALRVGARAEDDENDEGGAWTFTWQSPEKS